MSEEHTANGTGDAPADAVPADSASSDAAQRPGRPGPTADAVQGAQGARAAQPARDAPKPAGADDEDTLPDDFEPLTVTYERLRHSTDVAELSRYAREPLPDRADQAAFSRATALLEAVAGNAHTPVEDRVFLGETMPFPNILVKLSSDPEPAVRRAVAANEADKNWLVGLLTKDPAPEVRDAALLNPRTSWKMRLEGAQNPEVDAATLDVLGRLGVELEPDAPKVLASMVRRAVAANPSASAETKARLAKDPSGEVARRAAA